MKVETKEKREWSMLMQWEEALLRFEGGGRRRRERRRRRRRRRKKHWLFVMARPPLCVSTAEKGLREVDGRLSKGPKR